MYYFLSRSHLLLNRLTITKSLVLSDSSESRDKAKDLLSELITQHSGEYVSGYLLWTR